ncbi:MAG: PepSY-like domain-containing protein [Rikenellaceae bacterium]
MKKLLFVATLLLGTLTLSAKDKVIELSELPKSAQSFLSTNYSKDKVSTVTMEQEVFSKEYKVVLASGIKVKFDKNGDWTQVECKRNGQVPASIVPAYVANYVKSKFPSSSITKIEQENKSVEVELDNNVELKFNSKGELVKIDN